MKTDADLLRRLREFQKTVRGQEPRVQVARPAARTPRADAGGVLIRLRDHSPQLADSLEQAVSDLNDETRKTYVGAAGEAREVMRATIQLFAPDDEVRAQPWFKGTKQGDHVNPSQAERLRYAVQRQGGDEGHAAEAVDMIDERIGRLGRGVYQRASASFHATNQRQEVRKLIGWVFAVLDEVLPE